MKNNLLSVAALLGALAVITGAFGAHAVKSHISEESYRMYEKAVEYHFYHVFALLAAGILNISFPTPKYKWSGLFFSSGIVLFSGSLYLLSVKNVLGIEGWKWLVYFTPMGGLSFIAGWVLLFTGIINSKK